MRTLVSWSSGKDSAWSLAVLRRSPETEVVGLVTTINEAHDRVAMHGSRLGPRHLVSSYRPRHSPPITDNDVTF